MISSRATKGENGKAYRFQHIRDTKWNAETTDLLLLQTLEVSKQHSSNAPMANDKNMICHALNLKDDFTYSVDDVEIAFATWSRISIVEFIPNPKLKLMRILLFDLLIGHAFHITCVELV